MTDSEFLSYSSEHLDYEVRMFFRLGKLLLSKDKSAQTDILWAIDNALIESFVIHFRSLCDFFYLEPQKLDDVVAKHFFLSPSDWEVARPQLSTDIDALRVRVNKEVAHITEKRLQVLFQNKPWPVEAMLRELRDVVNIFAQQASPDRLHSNVQNFVGELEALLATERRFCVNVVVT